MAISAPTNSWLEWPVPVLSNVSKLKLVESAFYANIMVRKGLTAKIAQLAAESLCALNSFYSASGFLFSSVLRARALALRRCKFALRDCLILAERAASPLVDACILSFGGLFLSSWFVMAFICGDRDKTSTHLSFKCGSADRTNNT